MINPHQPRDIPQILLSVLFPALIIISCLWVVQPFILSFALAGTVVIATAGAAASAACAVRQTTAGGAGDDPVAVSAIRYSYRSAGQQPGG